MVTVSREAGKIAGRGRGGKQKKFFGEKPAGTNDEAFAELEKILNDGDSVLVKELARHAYG